MALFDNGFGPSQLRAELQAGMGISGWFRGRLVAYAMARKDEDTVDITRIAVIAEYRRQGLGRAILRLLMREVPSNKYVLCVRKTNLHALRLYYREGFRIVGMMELSWVMLKA